jgi:hypothetical protein
MALFLFQKGILGKDIASDSGSFSNTFIVHLHFGKRDVWKQACGKAPKDGGVGQCQKIWSSNARKKTLKAYYLAGMKILDDGGWESGGTITVMSSFWGQGCWPTIIQKSKEDSDRVRVRLFVFEKPGKPGSPALLISSLSTFPLAFPNVTARW